MPDTTPGTRLRDYAAVELAAAITHLGRRGGQLHEGVHQARKGLRRARATLALGGAALGPGAARLDRELRRVNTDLSVLRDAHALVETLDRLLLAGHDIETQRLLHRARRAAATARSACARAAQEADPGLAAPRALLTMWQAALRALPWAELAIPPLQAAIVASEQRMLRARAQALARGKDEDWHRWRRRARRLSQQRRALTLAGLEIAAVAFDKRTTERLGAAQDFTLLLDHCGRRSPFTRPDRDGLRRYAEPELARLRWRIAAADAPG